MGIIEKSKKIYIVVKVTFDGGDMMACHNLGTSEVIRHWVFDSVVSAQACKRWEESFGGGHGDHPLDNWWDNKQTLKNRYTYVILRAEPSSVLRAHFRHGNQWYGSMEVWQDPRQQSSSWVWQDPQQQSPLWLDRFRIEEGYLPCRAVSRRNYEHLLAEAVEEQAKKIHKIKSKRISICIEGAE